MWDAVAVLRASRLRPDGCSLGAGFGFAGSGGDQTVGHSVVLRLIKGKGKVAGKLRVAVC